MTTKPDPKRIASALLGSSILPRVHAPMAVPQVAAGYGANTMPIFAWDGQNKRLLQFNSIQQYRDSVIPGYTSHTLINPADPTQLQAMPDNVVRYIKKAWGG